jgi:hypothetical protein
MRRLLLSLLFVAPLTWAQAGRPDNLEPLPAIPPPPPDIQPFDEALEPEVTIRKDERGTVQEFRIQGKLYMVKVIPEVGPPYYLIDNDGTGNLTRSSIDPGLRVPMWVIGTF